MNQKRNPMTKLHLLMLTKVILILLISLLGFGACAGFGAALQSGAGLGAQLGLIDSRQADAIARSGAAIERSAEDINPEQEYFIGRAVAATILDQYQPYENPRANQYLNELGQSLALASTRPELFLGYRFLILDTDEINAFATPGGHIFISKGMIRLAKSEDDLAAILAHEIAHIEFKHGLQAIRTARLTSAFSSVAMTAVELASPAEIAELAKTFEDSINDITQTLVNSGYSRSAETEADKGAVRILKEVGYDPNGLIRVLEEMQKVYQQGGPGFFKTHPEPRTRIADIRREIGNFQPVRTNRDAKQSRFSTALAGI